MPRVDIKQGGGQISNVESTVLSVKHGTMSLNGSPKAKAVYEKSSKILFKQKWSIPKVYSFSPFLAGPNLLLESTQKSLKLFKKLHPQECDQLTQSHPRPQNYLQIICHCSLS